MATVAPDISACSSCCGMKPSRNAETSSTVNAAGVVVPGGLPVTVGAAAALRLAAVGGFTTGPCPQAGAQTSHMPATVAVARFAKFEISRCMILFLLRRGCAHDAVHH